MADEPTLQAARLGDESAFEKLLAPYRRELRAHCYRMAGSLHDADDLLQDSLVRAWKGLPAFEGRADLRTWLYRVTTTACLDALEKKSARLLPRRELGPALGADGRIGPPRLEPIWLTPCPAELYRDDAPGPEARLDQRQSVALAFLVALQLLTPRQRAVLLLRDVLGWQAAECAQLLDMSVAAVNSALQRARETLAARQAEPPAPPDASDAALLSRYVRAWELADITALVALLREDAALSMPPMPQWLQGPAAIGAAIQAMVFAPAGPGTFKLLPTEANGLPAFAVYRRQPATPGQPGGFRASGIHLLAARQGKLASIDAFLDPSLFAAFGFPESLPE